MERTEIDSKYEEFCNLFGLITNIIKLLPIHDYTKSIVLKEFDDAFLWSKEAFTQIVKNPSPEVNESNVVNLNPIEDFNQAS